MTQEDAINAVCEAVHSSGRNAFTYLVERYGCVHLAWALRSLTDEQRQRIVASGPRGELKQIDQTLNWITSAENLERYIHNEALSRLEMQCLRESAPMSEDVLLEMFSFVHYKLDPTYGDPVKGCNHTLRYTFTFVRAHHLDEDAVIDWVSDHGGNCDCEVIYNVTSNCYPHVDDPDDELEKLIAVEVEARAKERVTPAQEPEFRRQRVAELRERAGFAKDDEWKRFTDRL